MRRQIVPAGQFPPGQIQRLQRNDPFQQIQQIMMSFGGLNNDPFMNQMMMMGGDPLQDMFKFSDIHKNMHSNGNQGSFVMQSFVSSSKIGPDGQVIRQDYFQNNMGQHSQGNTISQKQQAYKNTAGVNRIAQQRMLNDRGRKIVKEKIGNNYEETNHYYNIDEEEANKFDDDWKREDRNQRFTEQMRNRISYMEPQIRQIGNQGYQQYQQYQQPSQNVTQMQAIRARQPVYESPITRQPVYQSPIIQPNYSQPIQQSYIQHTQSNYSQQAQSNYIQPIQPNYSQSGQSVYSQSSRPGQPIYNHPIQKDSTQPVQSNYSQGVYRPAQINFGVQGQGFNPTNRRY